MDSRPAKQNFTIASKLIKHHRQRLGMTMAALGERVGVSAQTIDRYETGEIAVSVLQVGRIAKAFGLPIVALLVDHTEGEAHGEKVRRDAQPHDG